MKKTRIDLAFRHFGRHSFEKSAILDVPYNEIVSERDGEPVVDEDALIAAMPPGWLRQKPSTVLLMVEDSAVGSPIRFRGWGKYFDAYSLTLYPE